MTGETQATNFPTTANAIQPVTGLFDDAFVVKLSTEMTWDGGGTTSDWSDAANWNGHAGTPGLTDRVVFDATSGMANIDAGASGGLRRLRMESGC